MTHRCDRTPARSSRTSRPTIGACSSPTTAAAARRHQRRPPNPRDAQQRASNVAVRSRAGRRCAPLLASELAIARFSGWHGAMALPDVAPRAPAGRGRDADAAAAPCSCSPRARSARRCSSTSTPPCAAISIDIAMFHISDRARHRGAARRRAPRRDRAADPRSRTRTRRGASQAFPTRSGRQRAGRRERRRASTCAGTARTASSSTRAGDDLRRERALVLTLAPRSHAAAISGDYDLDANVAIGARTATRRWRARCSDYFDTLWNNRAAQGIEYTADFRRLRRSLAVRVLALPAHGSARGCRSSEQPLRPLPPHRLLGERARVAPPARTPRPPRSGGSAPAAALPAPRSSPATSRPSRRPSAQSSVTCAVGALPPSRCSRPRSGGP